MLEQKIDAHAENDYKKIIFHVSSSKVPKRIININHRNLHRSEHKNKPNLKGKRTFPKY